MRPSGNEKDYVNLTHCSLGDAKSNESNIPPLTSLRGYKNLGTMGARPTKHISIEFEIQWKFKTL